MSQAIGLKRWMNPEFLLYLKFFNKILTHVSLFFNTMQNRKLDPTAVATAISNIKLLINHEREEVIQHLLEEKMEGIYNADF